MRPVPNHPPTCWLCAGTAWVCSTHPESPFFPSRLAGHCDCSEGVQCPLLRHGAAWFGQVGELLARCAAVRPRALRVVA